MNNISDLVRKCFAAYQSKDRGAIEALLSDDFTFSSPLDDNISRERYFERCWPNSERLRSFHIEKLFAEGNQAFVTYEAVQNDGAKFRNTEFFTSDGEKLKHVDVYFGTETANAAKDIQPKDPAMSAIPRADHLAARLPTLPIYGLSDGQNIVALAKKVAAHVTALPTTPGTLTNRFLHELRNP
ncbi:MAG: nuclear transport factor 2 family protein [Gloeobacteraceae cyanobacterium ES-bin-144]|nr:nuclear transport factor 2 family protein [Verrucomicrobiales bacterium]